MKDTAKTSVQGIRRLDRVKYPDEYYKLTVIAAATGLSATSLRKSPLRKFAFTNADWLRTEDVIRYLQNPSGQ